jgi:hypothetical protein
MSSFMQSSIKLAYPYTNQCILIARILTETSMVLKKYYTKTLILLRQQLYSKNVSRRVVEADGVKEGGRGSDVGVASRRAARVAASRWATGAAS